MSSFRKPTAPQPAPAAAAAHARKPLYTGAAPATNSAAAAAPAGAAAGGATAAKPASAAAGPASAASGVSAGSLAKQMSSLEIVNRSRRRLSVMGGANKGEEADLDGRKSGDCDADHSDIIRQVLEQSEQERAQPKEVYKSFYSLSKVGYVPFNPYKVNQVRLSTKTRDISAIFWTQRKLHIVQY